MRQGHPMKAITSRLLLLNQLTRHFLSRCVTILLISLCSGLIYAESTNSSVEFAIGNWPPYTSESNPKHLEALVTEVFRLHNYDVRFSYFPWKRSYERTKEGSSVATFPWYIDDSRNDRQNFLISKEAIFQETEVFFHLKDAPFEWQSFNDLKGLRIGGVNGYSHVHRLQKHNLSVKVIPSEKQVFLMLSAGRLDIVPASRKVGFTMINEFLTNEQKERITFHPKPLLQDNMYVFFSRKHNQGEHMAKLFDLGMQQLKSTGRIKELIKPRPPE